MRLFKQEAEVLAKVNHPGIPKVEVDGYFEFYPRDSQEPIHCFVMEKIEGEDLETYLEKRGKPIHQKLALKWLIEIAEILHQVHGQGFLHRDIKPANIMLRADGQLVLIDFGTVKEISATVMTSQAKKQGTGVYTPGYAPPEQEKGYTVPKSDFFALGRTMVHLLTNKPPLDFYNIDTDELNWRGAVPNLSPLLGDFLDELMQRLAKNRPRDTGALLQGLREIEGKIYPPSSEKPILSKPLPLRKTQAYVSSFPDDNFWITGIKLNVFGAVIGSISTAFVDLGNSFQIMIATITFVCGLYLCITYIRYKQFSKSYDFLFGLMLLLSGLIVFFQGWRLDPTLMLSDFLLRETGIFITLKAIRGRI